MLKKKRLKSKDMYTYYFVKKGAHYEHLFLLMRLTIKDSPYHK